jgi:hypothetical protein
VATTNRWQACFSLVFRVAEITTRSPSIPHPASRIRRRSEDNPSVRFLKADEEARLRN